MPHTDFCKSQTKFQALPGSRGLTLLDEIRENILLFISARITPGVSSLSSSNEALLVKLYSMHISQYPKLAVRGNHNTKVCILKSYKMVIFYKHRKVLIITLNKLSVSRYARKNTTMTSQWTPWRHESPASGPWLFAQSWVQPNINENISTPCITGFCEGNPPLTALIKGE